MADTTFVAQITRIMATWLNPVNKAIYRAIGTGQGGDAPETPADVRNNIGLTGQGGAALIGAAPGGTLAATTVQASLTELDTEKAPKASPTFTGTATFEGPVNMEDLLTTRNVQVDGIIQSFGGYPPSPVAYPAGFSASAGRFTRDAPNGGAGTVRAAVNVMTETNPGTTSFEWNQLNRLENYADAGENVSFYAQAYKHGEGSTWAGVFEVHDTGPDADLGSVYAMELDVSANGNDVTGGFHRRFGMLIAGYRNSGPTILMTASTAGTTMTVTVFPSGPVLTVGMRITAFGIPAGTTIASFGTGIGGVGTYTLSASSTTSSATKVAGGGEENTVGYGIIVTPADSDPWGNFFTYGVLLKTSGNVGYGHMDGTLDNGVYLSGYYNAACFGVLTPSSVPIINSVGSNNNALLAFASTDAMYAGSAAGAVAGKIKIIIDGNPFAIEIKNWT